MGRVWSEWRLGVATVQLSPQVVSCSPGAREATADWVTVSVCIAHACTRSCSAHAHTYGRKH